MPVVVSGEGALAPGLAATQSWLHTGDDDRGFVLTPCLEPSADVWLVAGGGGASRTERVIITNPGANAVSVAVEVFGAEGPVDASERSAVSIPPASRLSMSLDALAPDEPDRASMSSPRAASCPRCSATPGSTVRPRVVPTMPLRQRRRPGTSWSPGSRLPRRARESWSCAWSTWGRRGPRSGHGAHRARPSATRRARAVRVGTGSTLDVPQLAAGSSGLRIMSDRPLTSCPSDRRQATGDDREGDFGWVPALPPIAVSGVVALPGPVRPGDSDAPSGRRTRGRRRDHDTRHRRLRAKHRPGSLR